MDLDYDRDMDTLVDRDEDTVPDVFIDCDDLFANMPNDTSNATTRPVVWSWNVGT